MAWNDGLGLGPEFDEYGVPQADLSGFDYTSPNLEDQAPPPNIDSGPVVVGGVTYTQNPDGSWTGDDGAHGSDADLQAMIGDNTVGYDDPNYSHEGKNNPTPTGTSETTWDKVAAALKLKSPDGSYDLSKILALAGTGLGVAGALTDKPQTIKSMADLKAGMPALNAAQSFNPETLAMMQRPMQTGSALQRVYAADMPSPITPGKTSKQYAEGGEVEAPGALTQTFAGPVQGDGGGQADIIDAKLAGGEFVFDADAVAAAGDGNTNAGFKQLELLRQQLRAQKRSAPNDQIPEQVQGPLSSMLGA